MVNVFVTQSTPRGGGEGGGVVGFAAFVDSKIPTSTAGLASSDPNHAKGSRFARNDHFMRPEIRPDRWREMRVYPPWLFQFVPKRASPVLSCEPSWWKPEASQQHNLAKNELWYLWGYVED